MILQITSREQFSVIKLYNYDVATSMGWANRGLVVETIKPRSNRRFTVWPIRKPPPNREPSKPHPNRSQFARFGLAVWEATATGGGGSRPGRAMESWDSQPLMRGDGKGGTSGKRHNNSSGGGRRQRQAVTKADREGQRGRSRPKRASAARCGARRMNGSRQIETKSSSPSLQQCYC
ncbi:hypothetical protein Syun_025854 [Stephania yunnanensis]|uniref:Uncharacterized protein n=1 Tax=Stephania yunnanensis TaxID=152371 RepID=A0AAP0ESW9_9MAGN